MPGRFAVFSLMITCIMVLALVTSGCSSGYPAAAALKVQDLHMPESKDADIQEMIDRAEDGSEIVIPPGTYTISRPLMVKDKRDIRIKGSGDVRILGERIDRQIIIISGCDNIVLNGIRAWHKRNEPSDDKKEFDKRNGSVVDVENCGKVSFENCEFEGCGVYGVFTMNTREVDILGCYIHHNSWKAFGFHNQVGVTNVLVKDCIITNNADLVEKEGSINIRFEGANVIKANNAEGYKTGR